MFTRISPTLHVLAALAAASSALLLTGNALAQASVTARGNEPFWQLEIDGDRITFKTLDGDPIGFDATPISASNVDVYAASVDGRPFVAVLAPAVCTDSMSGMPFPRTALVILGDDRFTGCSGTSADLLHGEWRITEIRGAPIVVGSEPTLGFSPDGRIHGNGSCNRYFGSFALSGEGLIISETGASMMACEQGLMDQEQRLLAALATIRRFEIGARGDLLLLADSGPAIIALPQ